MTLKVGSKFKVKLTFGLKNDTKNLVHFHASSRKSENLRFDDWILLSMQRFRKSTGELCLMTEEWCKVWRKTDSWFQKWHEEFGEVGWNQWQVSHIDELLFLVTYKVSARKEQKMIFHDTEKDPNWLFIWKMTWGICWTLTWAVESLKICTWVDYFCRKYVMCKLKRYRRVVSWKMTWFQKWHK